MKHKVIRRAIETYISRAFLPYRYPAFNAFLIILIVCAQFVRRFVCILYMYTYFHMLCMVHCLSCMAVYEFWQGHRCGGRGASRLCWRRSRAWQLSSSRSRGGEWPGPITQPILPPHQVTVPTMPFLDLACTSLRRSTEQVWNTIILDIK